MRAIRNGDSRVLAMTDYLSSSCKRSTFISSAIQMLNESRDIDRDLSLALIDVDQFSNLNEAHGEAAGDQVLGEVVRICDEILKEAFPELEREGVGVARLGGEEFAFMLPTMDAALAVSFVENIREEIADLKINHGGAELQITISVGVAPLSDGDDVDSFLAHADAALNESKLQGRNKVVLYRPGMDPAPEGRRVTRTDRKRRENWKN